MGRIAAELNGISHALFGMNEEKATFGRLPVPEGLRIFSVRMLKYLVFQRASYRGQPSSNSPPQEALSIDCVGFPDQSR